MLLRTFTTICLFFAGFSLYGQFLCNKAATIFCGDVVQNSTNSATSIANNYDCELSSFLGPERVYKFTLTEKRNVIINLTDFIVNLDLLLLNDCDLGGLGFTSAEKCLASSTSNSNKESIIASLGPGIYYIVVDAKANVGGNFKLSLSCKDDLCERAKNISCGEYFLKQNTIENPPAIDTYPGCTNQSYGGSEKIYQINLIEDRSIQIGLHVDTNSKVEFDLFLVTLENCTEIKCLGQATPSAIKGSKYLFTETLAKGTYYVIVDSKGFFTSGEFSIDLACSQLPCNNLPALSCRAPISGTTSTGKNNVSLYRVRQAETADRYYPGQTGREKIYSFEVFEKQNVTLKLRQPTPTRLRDLNLFLLKSCNKLDAIAAAVTRGTGGETISMSLNPGIYYAVVDEFLSSEGSFTLTIEFTQACANICEFGGSFVSRGTTFSNELSLSEIAPILLYNEACVKDAFGGTLTGKKLYTDIFLFNNEDEGSRIVLNLNSTSGLQNLRGFIMRCSAELTTTCLGTTQNGILDLGPSPAGFYYVVIVGTQPIPYDFSITPAGVCQSNPQSIPLNTTIPGNVTGNKNDFNIGGSGYDAYSSCYNGTRAYQGEDVEFQFTIDANVDATITLSANSAMGLFLYGYICGKGCLDFTQTSSNGGTASIQNFPLAPGTYYLIVDKNTLGGNGQFTINISTSISFSAVVLDWIKLDPECYTSKKAGHTLTLVKPTSDVQYTANDKLYFFFDDPKRGLIKSAEAFWDKNISRNVMTFELKMDSIGDAQKCGFLTNDPIHIALERQDGDQQFTQFLDPMYDTPRSGAAVNAQGTFKPGGQSVITGFNLIKPASFAPDKLEIEVNPNRDNEIFIDFRSSVQFTIKVEPKVDYVIIRNPRSLYPSETTRIRIFVAKNNIGTPRSDVKLIFTSTELQPLYRREVLIKQRQCATFTTNIDKSTTSLLCPGSSIRLNASTSSGNLSDYTFLWSNGSTAPFIDLKDLKTGSTSYSVTVTGNDNQCNIEQTATTSINVLANPKAPVALKTEVGVCNDQVVPLIRVESQANTTTNWYDDTGTKLPPGPSAFTYLPRVSQPGEYLYYAEARSTEGCISERRTPIKLTLYPKLTLANAMLEKHVSCAGGNDGILNARVNEIASSGLVYRWSDSGEGVRRTGLKAGRYVASITFGAGCVQEFSTDIIEPDSIKIAVKTIKPDSSSKSNGGIDVEINGGTPPYRYKWMRNGQAFSETQDLTNISGGNYQLEVTDRNQCVRLSPVLSVASINLTSTIEHPWSSLVKISPNPSNGLINVTFDLPQSTEVRPEIVNALGESITQLPPQQMLKGSIQMQIFGVGSGVYFLRLRFPEGLIVKRVLLIH